MGTVRRPPAAKLTIASAVLMLAALMAIPAGSTGSEERGLLPPIDPPDPPVCDGVVLLSRPLLVIHVPGQPDKVVGPPTNIPICEKLGLPLAAHTSKSRAAGHCKYAQIPAYRLRTKLATKATRCLINRERVQHHDKQLDQRKQLKRAAKRHSRRMLSGCFAHECPGEKDLVGRVTDAGYLPCNCAWSVGENIAWGAKSNSTPKAIVRAWMHSPPHRAMILNGTMRDFDIGVKHGKPGAPRADAATFTADFGRRSG